MAAIARRLPFGLSEVVAPNIVGYLIINGCTFCLDLILLTVFHGGLKIVPWLAVTMSYSTAGIVSYIANRVFNFESHGAVGRQVPLQIAALASNYFIFVLGLFDLLVHVGVQYDLARVLAACCEGVYLYSAMRWVVFRDVMGTPSSVPQHAAEAQAAVEAQAVEAAVVEAAEPEASAGTPTPESPRPAVPARTPES
jgi:putative flippase GtrA